MLCQEAPKRYHTTNFSEWLAFVPAPRTLSFEVESTTDSIIQSVDKPILRVSHAMLCREAPKRYADTKISEEFHNHNSSRRYEQSTIAEVRKYVCK